MIDRVNNVKQKEEAAHRVGLTREKALAAIVLALDAVKVQENPITYVLETVPDIDRRLKAAEIAGKFFGDFKESEQKNSNETKVIVIQSKDENGKLLGTISNRGIGNGIPQGSSEALPIKVL